MKRWNKTVILWDFGSAGHNTDLPVDDWHEPGKKLFHTIHKIEATALPDRVGEIKVTIHRVAICPTTKRQLILKKLSSVFKGKVNVRDDDNFSSVFIIGFDLIDGDKFCDTAIEIVSDIYKVLGVNDQKGWKLSWFTISQETFIELEKDAWISFARWLRINHHLPINGPED